MSRIAVVTGGAGFIGSHAVDSLLSRGFQVRIIDDLSGGRLKNVEHVIDLDEVDFFENSVVKKLRPPAFKRRYFCQKRIRKSTFHGDVLISYYHGEMRPPFTDLIFHGGN